MKTKFCLFIDNDILLQLKRISSKEGRNISELIREYIAKGLKDKNV